MVNFVLFLAFFVLVSCNHVYYQPDSYTYTTPTKALQMPYEDVWFGDPPYFLPIHSWILKRTPKPKALVIHFHGNAQNMSSHFLFFAWLADYNYAVATFDYRGYGDTPGEPTRAGVTEDGLLFLESLAKRKDLADIPWVVVGQSLGGNIAISSMVHASEDLRKRVKILILDSTFSSYRDVAQEKLNQIWLTWPLQVPLSYLVSDEESAKYNINKLSLPIVFVHDLVDPVVSAKNTQTLYDLYQGPKRLWFVTEGKLRGHTSAFSYEDSVYRMRLLNLFGSELSKVPE